MNKKDFDQAAAKTNYAPKTIKMLERVLVQGELCINVARDSGVTSQRLYDLRKEFLEAAGWTTTQRLITEMQPLMKRLKVPPLYQRKIVKFIAQL